MRFIVEHLDPAVYPWSLCEYRHISEIVGKKSLWFTHVRSGKKKLKPFGKIFSESITEQQLTKVCVLDPTAKTLLRPSDSQRFESFVFGGILGDAPARKRTKQFLTSKMKCVSRHLGPRQLPTDQAVLVAKKILVDKLPFQHIRFIEELIIPTDRGEEVILPFRFVVEAGKPALARGYETMIRKNGF